MQINDGYINQDKCKNEFFVVEVLFHDWRLLIPIIYRCCLIKLQINYLKSGQCLIFEGLWFEFKNKISVSS